MSITSNIQQLNDIRKTLATNINDKGVEAEQTEGFATLVPKVAEIKSAVYNASREWSAAHPTYNNAEDILADYTAGICYIFLGSITLTIPSNGKAYYTKDGEVTAGSEVTLECEDGMETSWLVEEYDVGATATMSYAESRVQNVGVGFKAVTCSCGSAFNGAYGTSNQSLMFYAIFAIGGAVVSHSGMQGVSCLYVDDYSLVDGNIYSLYTMFVNDRNSSSYYNGVLADRIVNEGVITLPGYATSTTSRVREICLPNVSSLTNRLAFSAQSPTLKRIRVGNITNRSFAIANTQGLVDFEFGAGQDLDITFSGWTCTSVTADKSASLLLISNTRRHILDKVADHTGEGLVRTITCGWVGTLEESEDDDILDALELLMDDFVDKGWNLQG